MKYEVIITNWINAIDSLKDGKAKDIFKIALSDALTRKFVIRMMGTGVGRFALEIAKTSIDKLMFGNINQILVSVRAIKTLIDDYHIEPASANVVFGTAVAMLFADNTFSIIVTSPPYLPASSGREDYLIGKAISNTALKLMNLEEIEIAETQSVGSMKAKNIHQYTLPESVYNLYNWLLNDQLRNIKAIPTLSYYESLKTALTESFRVLRTNGIAIYVIGKESVFYTFSTREVVYKVECDKIFEDIAKSCGFIIVEKTDIELDKKNKNARPRSRDSYYETVFVLKKND